MRKKLKMDLFADQREAKIEIAADAYLLKSFALADETQLLNDLTCLMHSNPLRKMVTPSGLSMSVATMNCGDVGWISDRKGYRYAPRDPLTSKPWPAMPPSFRQLAVQAAASAGYSTFEPDACLINQYSVGARMGLHPDKDEMDFSQPIVSVSFGLSAIFQFGGLHRTDKTIKVLLEHGDVVVWGGESRLWFHGILPVKTDTKSAVNHNAMSTRINLTFRKAGK